MYLIVSMWGVSSAGRAPVLHAGGQEFDPPTLHHFLKLKNTFLESVLFLFSVFSLVERVITD